MKVLYLLCGPSGSGKSTFAKLEDGKRKLVGENCLIISRDIIRFSLLKDGEDYFAHEKEVFNIFIKEIQNGINNSCDTIVVDATNLNEGSRNKVLDKIEIKDYKIIVINFLLPLEECLKRNEKREGRAKVPHSVIRRQFSQFTPATYGEKHKYFKVFDF